MAGSLKFDTWLNDDDTENYKCRAWVNFNGTGTVAIRASGNVSSITDNGTGDYTANFANALPDADYSIAGYFNTGSVAATVRSVGGIETNPPLAGSVRFNTAFQNASRAALADATYVNVAIFR